jgi:hypothetical protein
VGPGAFSGPHGSTEIASSAPSGYGTACDFTGFFYFALLYQNSINKTGQNLFFVWSLVSLEVI